MSSRHQGIRCIGVVRSDTELPTDSSGQLDMLRAFAGQQDMSWVGQVILCGPLDVALRKEMDALVARKHSVDDFDAVLLHSRSCCGELDLILLFDVTLRRAGIRIISATEPLAASDFSWIVQYLPAAEKKEYGRLLSKSISASRTARFKRRDISHTSPTPIGIDKLYCTRSGQRLWIIRSLPNGERVQFNARTMEVVRRYGRGRGYVKTDDETVTLIPGDPAVVDLIGQMFRWRYHEHLPPGRIARRLNEQDVPLPTRGKLWRLTGVRNIVRNPIYLGFAITNRGYGDSFHTSSDQSSLRSYRHQAQRPSNEWIVVHYPALSDAFISPELRPVVRDHLERALKVHLDGGGR